MRSKTVRASYDTWVGSVKPNKRHGDHDFLFLDAGRQEAFIWSRIPARRKTGAVASLAKIQLFARGSSTGVRNVSAERVADDWVASDVTWNDKPGTVGTTKFVAIGDLADGDMIEIDVTQHAQTMIEGAPNYGWKLTTDATTSHRFYGADGPNEYRPRLYVEWSVPPAAPTGPKPAGGVVGQTHPILSVNPPPDGHLQGMRVQIDPAANASSPAFDSGEVSTTEPQLDLADTLYAGLPASTQWRAKYQVDGVWSDDWTDWVSLGYRAKPTLVIDNPPVSGIVTEPTPPLFGTFSGEPLTAWQTRITPKDDRTRVLYDSAKQDATSTTDIADETPFRHEGRRVLRDDVEYSINMRGWGTEDRVPAVGAPVFVSEWRDFVMDNDLAVAPPTNLVATPDGVTPFNVLTWECATAPDSFVIRRDGSNLEAELDPVDLFVSGTTYQYRDHEATPRKSHAYRVKAVANRKQSEPSNIANAASRPEGVWILDYKRGLSFVLSGMDVDNWVFTEQGVIYNPIGSPVSVRIITSQRGMSGTFKGRIRPAAGRSIDSFMDDVWKIKGRPKQTLQLVALDWSFPVKLDDLSPGLDKEWTPERPTQLVSFGFRQVGDFQFNSRV